MELYLELEVNIKTAKNAWYSTCPIWQLFLRNWKQHRREAPRVEEVGRILFLLRRRRNSLPTQKKEEFSSYSHFNVSARQPTDSNQPHVVSSCKYNLLCSHLGCNVLSLGLCSLKRLESRLLHDFLKTSAKSCFSDLDYFCLLQCD